MNIPNRLTVLRICMVPLFVFFMLADFVPHRFLWALIVFAVASYTDHLDGKIARSRGLITNFGKLMDPLADKILVMAALICFVELNLSGSAAVILIMFREFGVTSIRLIAAEQGQVIPANNWGKAKTISQMAAILSILGMQAILEFIAAPAAALLAAFSVCSGILIWTAVVLTVISGLIYVKDSASLFQDK